MTTVKNKSLQPDDALGDLIPEELRGKNTQLSSTADCASEGEAAELFERAKDRLLRPSQWQALTGSPGAAFMLFDEKITESAGPAKVGDYIRIDVPGPGSRKGDGYDWVKVLMIHEHRGDNNTAYVGMKVTPSDNPTVASDKAAHFLEAGSTSTFLVRVDNASVTASYFGRNEKINAKADGIADKIRNTVVGLAAFAGLSELQWKALINGFIKTASKPPSP